MQTGDLLQTNLRTRQITLLDRAALRERGEALPFTGDLAQERRGLGQERRQRIEQRRLVIVPTNRMDNVTDSSRGVVPLALAESAAESLSELAYKHLALAGD